jgi:hypothetical protein
MEVKVVLCEILLPLLLLCLHAWRFVDGVQFEVSSRTTKCVAEEIQSDVLVVGDYKIVSSSEENLRITIKVCVTHTISDSLSLSLSLCLMICCRFCFWEMGVTTAAMITGHGANSYY